MKMIMLVIAHNTYVCNAFNDVYSAGSDTQDNQKATLASDPMSQWVAAAYTAPPIQGCAPTTAHCLPDQEVAVEHPC
jgi:hypothetical protein